MEAIDRLVKCEDDCPDACTPCCNDCDYGAAYEDGTNAQDEISLKAGMKKVVDFIGEEPFEHNYDGQEHLSNDCFACRWQTQLKEWGIEEVKEQVK